MSTVPEKIDVHPILASVIDNRSIQRREFVDALMNKGAIILARHDTSPPDFFPLTSFDDLRWYLGRQDGSWCFATIDPEVLNSILEFNRIYKLGLKAYEAFGLRLAKAFDAAEAQTLTNRHPIMDLNLPKRVKNALHFHPFVEDLYGQSKDEILGIKHIGKVAYGQIIHALLVARLIDPARKSEGIYPPPQDESVGTANNPTFDDDLDEETDGSFSLFDDDHHEDDEIEPSGALESTRRFLRIDVYNEDDDTDSLGALGRALKEALKEVKEAPKGI